MSVNATDPGTFIGGTWERLKDRFLLGAGDSYSAGSTGGEASHKLSIDEMPKHYHFQNGYTNAADGSGNKYGQKRISVDATWTEENISTAYEGGSEPHNNMPPYLAVYMWVRTA